MWHVIHDTWNITRDMWHVTLDMWHMEGGKILTKLQVSSSYGLGVKVSWRFGGGGNQTNYYNILWFLIGVWPTTNYLMVFKRNPAYYWANFVIFYRQNFFLNYQGLNGAGGQALVDKTTRIVHCTLPLEELELWVEEKKLIYCCKSPICRTADLTK